MADCRCGAHAHRACPKCLQVRCDSHLVRGQSEFGFCAPTGHVEHIDRADRGDVAREAMAVQSRMIAACRSYAETYMADIEPNVEISGIHSSKRRKIVAAPVAGWVLATEVDHSNVAYEYQIVLLETGEIFCDRGIGRLTTGELTEDYWAVPGWFESAFERYGLTPWPTGIEDLRRLSIEFYLASVDAPSERTKQTV